MIRNFILVCLITLTGIEVSAQTNIFPNSGFVGIGTTNPTYPLHIINTSPGSPATISLKSAYAGTSDVYVGGFGDYGAVLSYNMDPANGTFTNNAISPNQFKAAAISVGGYNNPFMFSVTNFPSGNVTPRMVVDWNGNAGIGTPSPVSKLDIVTGVGDGSTNEANCLRLRHTGTAGNAQLLQLGVSNVAAGGNNNGYGYISSVYWGASDNEPLVLNPKGGPVGFGLTSGVNWAATVNGTIAVRASSTTANNALMGKLVFAHWGPYTAQSSFIAGVYDKSAFSSGAGMVFHTISGSDISGVDGVERMRISSDGNVGIGTSNPAATLHILPASVGDGGVKFSNAINGYSSLIWASNNVGFGLVAGGGLYALANAGYGLSIGSSAVNTSSGAMLNIKGSGATSSSYSMKIQNSSSSDLFTVRDDGNVGIGTVTPAATLHIVPASVGDGGVKFSNAINGYSSLIWASNNVGFGLVSGGGLYALANAGYGLSIGSSAVNTSAGAMLNIKGSGASSSSYSMKIQNSSSSDVFTVRDDGNIGIGTTSPQEKLAVNGNIVSQKVRVTSTGWSDYVFDPGYKLRPLTEVENYIQQQHHLPEVPSATEVEKNGLDVGDNQATLLKKIEELTLYVIEQNKTLQNQQKLIEQQASLLKSQQEQLDVLKKEIKK